MKTIKLLTLLAIFIGFSSCSNDDDEPTVLQVESETVTNLYAPQVGGQGTSEPKSGVFTKFDFTTGTTTTSATEWDIAFRGTDIILNGGTSYGELDEPERTGNAAAYFSTGVPFAEVTSVNISLLEQDSVNGYVLSDWYEYNFDTHTIDAVGGRVMIIRTRDGKYAKMEIFSYYEDRQANAELDNYRYYTFQYVYQPNEGLTTF